MDKVIITHDSAFFYWLSVDPSAWTTASPTRANVVGDGSLSASHDFFNYANPDFGNAPVHLLVDNPLAVRRNSKVTCHTSTVGYPPGSFFKMQDRVYIASPELSALQMATCFDVTRLAEACSQLCANYFVNSRTDVLQHRSNPPTSITALTAYVARASHIHGSVKLACALRYVIEATESPMEIKTAILLCLPYKYGGYGIPKPLANQWVEPRMASALHDKTRYRPDLSWANWRVAVEYDGKAAHEDSHKDKRRINSFEAMDWKVFSITKETI